MKKRARFIWAILICVTALSLGFCRMTVYDTPQKQLTKNEDTAESGFPAASVTKSETEKFILRYNPDTSNVILITQKTDGSEIHSAVEEVNPFFLTDEDVKKLTGGIEVSTKEELFMLIEDLSS